MEEIGEKYLPIGTVVMLKGGTKRVMISGFCAIDGENVKNMYDYSGCVYPEGFLTSTQTCLFNHEQIEKVYHMGLLDDEEETNFNNKLKELVEKAKQKEFGECDKLIAEANECLNDAHKSQTELLQMEARGEHIDIGFITVHAQDHLMTTILLKDIINNLLDIYR